jgi:intracellular sulfur oxidation DsrE/DsrF family protein
MRLLLLAIVAVLACQAHADMNSFRNGPVFKDFGPVADVDTSVTIPANTTLRHVFDVGAQSENGEPNRTLVSAARFINMHARAGVETDRIQVAVIVHGKAIYDVSGIAPDNAELVAALVDHGVKIYVCGQTAAYYDVATSDLLPGVEMALSAMTMHALLQQQGYTLNPF